MKLRKISGSTGPSNPDVSLPSEATSCNSRSDARPGKSEIRAGSVLGHVTKRFAVITPLRAPVVLRFLLKNPEKTVCFWPDFTTL